MWCDVMVIWCDVMCMWCKSPFSPSSAAFADRCLPKDTFDHFLCLYVCSIVVKCIVFHVLLFFASAVCLWSVLRIPQKFGICCQGVVRISGINEQPAGVCRSVGIVLKGGVCYCGQCWHYNAFWQLLEVKVIWCVMWCVGDVMGDVMWCEGDVMVDVMWCDG